MGEEEGRAGDGCAAAQRARARLVAAALEFRREDVGEGVEDVDEAAVALRCGGAAREGGLVGAARAAGEAKAAAGCWLLGGPQCMRAAKEGHEQLPAGARARRRRQAANVQSAAARLPLQKQHQPHPTPPARAP